MKSEDEVRRKLAALRVKEAELSQTPFIGKLASVQMAIYAIKWVLEEDA